MSSIVGEFLQNKNYIWYKLTFQKSSTTKLLTEDNSDKTSA